MIELIDGKKHLVLKRKGFAEPYNPSKMEKVVYWAVKEGITQYYIEMKTPEKISEEMINNIVQEILEDVKIRIFDKIRIEKLYDEVIDTVVNKINRMTPFFDNIAKFLFVQKIYKEIWGIKRNEYPEYQEVLKKGIQYKVYNKNILDEFSEDELNQLSAAIDQTRDFKFTYGGLDLFMKKYPFRYTKTKILELPQHAMMRVAIQKHYKDKNRIEKIIEKYNMISFHEIAIPSPDYLNSLAWVYNPTSCVLAQPDDDSESIMEAARSLAIYSKNASGTGLDATRIRAVGSSIGVDGVSSGVVPFLKVYEGVISAWNQKSARVGACAVYYPWWHYESPEIMMLKDAGGSEDERARKLKYAIKWNSYLTRAVKKNEEIYLFDPKDVPDLIQAHGEEFDRIYEEYKEKADKGSIRKRKYSAREFAFLYAKSYSDTGNNYWMNFDEANRRRMCTGIINQSNLCTEVMLSTQPLVVKNSQLQMTMEQSLDEMTEEREVDGEIGICNLVSVNLIPFDKKSPEEKFKFCYSLLLGMDNSIEISDYPVKAGEKFNKLHRAVGVSPTNYHQFIAYKGFKASDEGAKKVTHEIMESLSFYLTKASIELAKERGKYHYFPGSRWEKGEFIHESSKLPEDLSYELKEDWEGLRPELLKYGVRFEFLMATVPGQTSSLALNFTEGGELIREFKTIKEGTYNIPFLAPNITKYGMLYETSWEVRMETILELTAIRQKFVDQSQSTNLYIENPKSAYAMLKLIFKAEELGLKSLYYMNTKKKEVQEECENCSV